jgi:hypothetical protein
MQGIIPPNSELILVSGQKFDYETCFLIILLSWTLKPEIRYFLQGNLLDFNIKKQPPEKRLKLLLALESRKAAFEIYAQQNSERDWFGNKRPRLIKLIEKLQFQWYEQRPGKKKVHRRGYDDHGTLRPSDKWLEKHCWTFTEMQNRVEKERQTYLDTIEFLKGWYQ